MTAAKTSEKLALELDKLGLDYLAVRARANEFHDFLSASATPEMDLVNALGAIMARQSGAKELRERVINGDFDASLEESDDWARSKEGQETFEQLLKGK